MVKTNFWPLRWLYHASYFIALRVIVYILKKQPGIVAIYLISSMAVGDTIYGLSDIDLIIIVNDNPKTKWRLERIYRKLCRVIPFLKRDEMGIYSTADIRRSYGQSDLYLKYKFFTECKKQGRLLYGTDILREFNLLGDMERNEFILGQLAFIWSIFLKNFLIGSKTSDTLMRNYVCYKVTSDICKVVISARDNQDLFNRKNALERAAGYFDEPQRLHIERVRALAKSRFTAGIPHLVSDTYDFCMRGIQMAIEDMPPICGYDESGEIVNQAQFEFEGLDLVISEVNRRKIDALAALARDKYKEYIRGVLVSSFDLLHIDEESICVFIAHDGPIPFEAIKEFNAIIGSGHSPQHLYLYMVNSEMAISLNRFEPGQIHSVFFPLQWMQVTALYLSSPFSVIWVYIFRTYWTLLPVTSLQFSLGLDHCFG